MRITKLLTAIILMSVMAIGFTSCSKDDDEENDGTPSYEQKIIGTWVYRNMSYRFDDGGTGWYHAGDDISGDFRYTMTGISFKMNITLFNSTYHNVWHYETTGSYNPEQDNIRIDGNVFTRQK